MFPLQGTKSATVETDKFEIEQFNSGDLKAFEMIFRRYYKALVRYANTIVKDMDEAEDIVQQVFINLWEKAGVMEVQVSLRSVLYRSVHNAALNRLKKQVVHSGYVKEMMGQEMAVAEITYHKELQQQISEALDQLPEQCARIFKMSRFDNLKYKEIAEALNLSVKTVENQMGKALKIMREELKHYLPVFILLSLLS